MWNISFDSKSMDFVISVVLKKEGSNSQDQELGLGLGTFIQDLAE